MRAAARTWRLSGWGGHATDRDRNNPPDLSRAIDPAIHERNLGITTLSPAGIESLWRAQIFFGYRRLLKLTDVTVNGLVSSLANFTYCHLAVITGGGACLTKIP